MFDRQVPESSDVCSERNFTTDESMYSAAAQVGIMFAQVGNDPGATQLLTNLDNKYQNNLKRRDIVDTFKSNLSNVSWTYEDWNFVVVKLLLGAIDKNVDDTDHKPASAGSAAYDPQQSTSQPYGSQPAANQSYGYQPPTNPFQGYHPPPTNPFYGYQPTPSPSQTYGFTQPPSTQPSGYGYQQPPPNQSYGYQQPPPPYPGAPLNPSCSQGGANASYYNYNNINSSPPRFP